MGALRWCARCIDIDRRRRLLCYPQTAGIFGFLCPAHFLLNVVCRSEGGATCFRCECWSDFRHGPEFATPEARSSSHLLEFARLVGLLPTHYVPGRAPEGASCSRTRISAHR